MAKIEFTNEDIRQHLQMQQDIINRFAANSSNCKTWLIAIVAALTALQMTSSHVTGYGWLLPLLSLILYFLDSYYLGLERAHIADEKKFLEKVRGLMGNEDVQDIPGLYEFSNTGVDGKECKIWRTIKAMGSFSTYPFYGAMIILTVVLSRL